VLDQLAYQTGLTKKINAAANTLVAVFRRRPELANQKLISLDVLPFACLPSDDGMFALAEYAVFKEKSSSADRSALAKAIRRGISALMLDNGPDHDVWKFALWRELDRGEPPLWSSLLDDETITLIIDGAQESARRLQAKSEDQKD
jgi:hypothetical protein